MFKAFQLQKQKLELFVCLIFHCVKLAHREAFLARFGLLLRDP